MNSIARAIICLSLVFLFATFASAETKKTAVSIKVMNEIFRQLVLDCRTSTDTWDEVKMDKPKEYVEIKSVPLSKGKTTYLISGMKSPFFGAHAPMHWIYEKTDSGYRRVDELGAKEDVHILKSSHNGYRDIGAAYILKAGTEMEICKLIFDGSKYVDAGCKIEKLRR